MDKITLSLEQQRLVVELVRDKATEWGDQLKAYKNRMRYIDSESSTFSGKREADWLTAFKVNKAFSILEKTLPKIVGRDPKRIVDINTDTFDEEDKLLSDDQRAEKLAKLKDYAMAIRDYLSYISTKDEFRESVRLWAKMVIKYGIGRAKPCYRYEIDRAYENVEQEVEMEDGSVYKEKKKNVKESVIGEYPTIEVRSWTDILFDPRHLSFNTMPGVIETIDGLRMSYFTQNKDKYDNIDNLMSIFSLSSSVTMDTYKQTVQSLFGIEYQGTDRMNRDNLNLKIFSGYASLTEDSDGSDEKMYEFQILNDTVCVSAKLITQIPFHPIRCFYETNSFLSVGLVEPTLGLQEELNFKKNAASQYINQALNRSFFRSPNSGVNPKYLNSKHGNIIPTTKSGKDALENVVELPFRPLPSDYFADQNDLERQIQAMSFTIDTTTPKSDQGLTQTATGIKVKYFESNEVADEIRKHFESGLEAMAYKLLKMTFDNTDDNIVIKKLDDEGFREINKEAMANAVKRYNIKVQAGSSSFDSVEQKRNDAIAAWNIAQQAAAVGVSVDLETVYMELMSTFEGMDTSKLIKKQQGIPGMMPQGPQPSNLSPVPQQTTSNPLGISKPTM